MAAYHFKAIDAQGRGVDGQLTADTRAAALSTLSARGLVPIDLYDALPGGTTSPRAAAPPGNSFLHRLRPPCFGQDQLLQVTQVLASLVRAGLTVDRAIGIASHLSEDAAARSFLGDVGKKVRAGATFARAVAASGQQLPNYYVSMVEAGEAGGALATTLARLSELLKAQRAVRQRISSALVYPAILMAVVLVTLVLLLGFVLPRFEQLFAESDARLPLATQMVLAVGRFVSDYGVYLAMAAAIGVLLGVRWVRSDRGRSVIHHWFLRSRLLLGLPASIDTARLLRTLATLSGNGLPLPAALKVARGTLSNDALRVALDAAAARVKAGEPLHAALAAEKVFPPVAAQLSRVGEETGRLDELLLSAAEYLEEQSGHRLDRLLALLVPVLTVGMGLIVAALIGAVLMGLLSINDLAF